MTDPKFETRAELEAWATQTAHLVKLLMLETLHDIRRVTLAHSHLIGEK